MGVYALSPLIRERFPMDFIVRMLNGVCSLGHILSKLLSHSEENCSLKGIGIASLHWTFWVVIW